MIFTDLPWNRSWHQLLTRKAPLGLMAVISIPALIYTFFFAIKCPSDLFLFVIRWQWKLYNFGWYKTKIIWFSFMWNSTYLSSSSLLNLAKGALTSINNSFLSYISIYIWFSLCWMLSFIHIFFYNQYICDYHSLCTIISRIIYISFILSLWKLASNDIFMMCVYKNCEWKLMCVYGGIREISCYKIFLFYFLFFIFFYLLLNLLFLLICWLFNSVIWSNYNLIKG